MQSVSTQEGMLLQAFSERLAAEVGLSYPRERWPELLGTLDLLGRDAGLVDASAYMRYCLLRLPQRSQVEALAKRLSVGETCFFRDTEVFEALEHEILPALVARRRSSGRRLRLWSAGCATGEEAYSLAILLQRVIPDLPDWDVSVLGTDIHPGFLASAARGAYRDWSFRGVPDWVQGRYFDSIDQGQRRIKPEIGRMVKFRYLNLASDACTSTVETMDLVLCRHVLMYFDATLVNQVLKKRLYPALADDGWLLMSSPEVGIRRCEDFAMAHAKHLPFYRKASAIRAQLGDGQADRNHSSASTMTAKEARAPSGISVDVLPIVGDVASCGQVAASLMAQAISHADRRALGEALICCEAALVMDKCHAELHYLHALILEECGRFEDMNAALQRVLFLDPGFVLARVALGRLRMRQGRKDDADRYCTQAGHWLGRQRPCELVADSGGFTAGRLSEALLGQGRRDNDHINDEQGRRNRGFDS